MADTDKDAPPPSEGEAEKGPEEGDELEKQFYAGEERTLRELKEEAERKAGLDTSARGEPQVEGEEELERLLRPKRSARHPILAFIVIGASLYGMWWLWDDLVYFLRPRKPLDLGKVTVALKEGRIRHNTYVTLEGMPLPQSMASTKMHSLLGGSRDRRTQWLILSGTGNQVLVSQPVTPVSPRARALPKSTDEIQGTFTGRLRLLSRTDFDANVRSDYLRLSRESPMLRPYHRVAGAEILQKAGQPGAELKDVQGERFRVDAETMLEMFVTFPEEYELDIHTDQKDEIKPDIVKGEKIPPLLVSGGDGAPRCGPAEPWPPTGAAPSGGAPAQGAPSGGAAPMAAGAAPMAAGAAPMAAGAAPSGGAAPMAAGAAPMAAGAAPPAARVAAPPAGAVPQTRTRRIGWGGSVFLRFDPKIFLLDHLAGERELKAESGRAGDPPESAPDRVVAVPPGTHVYNEQARDCKRACRWEGPECLKGCSTEPFIEIQPVGKQVLLATGGDCGGGAGERHAVSLAVMPFPDAKRAEAFVASLGHPYVLTEDNSRTSRMVRFIVRLPEAVARDLTRKQRRSSPYNIAPRFEVFRARWKHLAQKGSDLVFTRTLRGYPQEHEVVVKDGKRFLRPVPLGSTLRIAGRRVVKADITQLLKLPADAYLLEVGVKPSDMWMQPFLPGVPVFYLLLALFIVLNLMAIRTYFRK